MPTGSDLPEDWKDAKHIIKGELRWFRNEMQQYYEQLNRSARACESSSNKLTAAVTGLKEDFLVLKYASRSALLPIIFGMLSGFMGGMLGALTLSYFAG